MDRLYMEASPGFNQDDPTRRRHNGDTTKVTSRMLAATLDPAIGGGELARGLPW